MADSTQELMLRVRGDNSGVDKAVAGTERAVKRLSVSGQKAGQAFKSFSRSLAEARDASDVAASAAESLGQIVGKSLIGAVAVGGVKLFTDQITRMGEMLKEVATTAQKSFDDIEKAGQAMSLSEAIAQTASVDANIASINNKLAELNRSPFQKFISDTTGATKELNELVKSQQRLRDAKLAEGIASENAHDKLIFGLDDESKKLREIDDEYRKKQKTAQSMTNQSSATSFLEDAGEMMIRRRNAIYDKQSKDRLESQIKFDKMIFDAEQKLADQAETREKNTEQERVQRKIDNNNRIYREERYSLDEKIKTETNADDTKFKRLVRDANRAREDQKRATQTSADTSGGVLGATRAGRQALELARKLRERQLKTENYKVAERIAPTQREREKMAAQQVAGEMPSLGEQIRGGLTGVSPSQIAREEAAKKFERDRMVGKPGFKSEGGGQTDLSKETLKAIQSLVDLMKSGTVVK
jgi:hypothetical protein